MLGIDKPATVTYSTRLLTHTNFTETWGHYRAVSQTSLRAYDYVCFIRVSLACCPRSSGTGSAASATSGAGASEAANDTCLLRGPALSKWARCAAQSLA